MNGLSSNRRYVQTHSSQMTIQISQNNFRMIQAEFNNKLADVLYIKEINPQFNEQTSENYPINGID